MSKQFIEKSRTLSDEELEELLNSNLDNCKYPDQYKYEGAYNTEVSMYEIPDEEIFTEEEILKLTEELHKEESLSDHDDIFVEEEEPEEIEITEEDLKEIFADKTPDEDNTDDDIEITEDDLKEIFIENSSKSENEILNDNMNVPAFKKSKISGNDLSDLGFKDAEQWLSSK